MLTVAGSDSCGGAGIQADIKTACAFDVYAQSAITAVTVQGICGVKKIIPISPEDIAGQIRIVAEEHKPEAVKIGMLPSADAVMETARCICDLQLKNVVCDPVMAASTGQSLCSSGDELKHALTEYLFPLCTIVTPNIPEAEKLCPSHPEDASLMRQAWRCGAVLLKGGHGSGSFLHDILATADGCRTFEHARIHTINTHGTGCTLSSAIASSLAVGMPLIKAVEAGIDFVNSALSGNAGRLYCAQGGPLYFFNKQKPKW